VRCVCGRPDRYGDDNRHRRRDRTTIVLREVERIVEEAVTSGVEIVVRDFPVRC